MDNLTLWRSVEKTDPKHTKGFSGKGGFKGTAIAPMFLIRRATELWGPFGENWGVHIEAENVYNGAPIRDDKGQIIGCESVHSVRITLFYPGVDGCGEVPAFGNTIMVGQNKYGPFTDEDAPKKSLTDAIGKALSWLGFAADVHMGRYDDNKYVNDLKAEFANGFNGRCISPEQLAELNTLLEGTHTDLGRFLNWADVSALDALPASKFAEAVNQLKRKGAVAT